MQICAFIPREQLEFQLDTPKAPIQQPFQILQVSAGFPSPAESAAERSLNLHDLLVQHSAATFFIRVEGDSMQDAGIFSGDILVVDRAVKAKSGHIVVAILHEEFTVKRLRIEEYSVRLEAANPNYPDIPVKEDMNFQIWGVVRYAIHQLSQSPFGRLEVFNKDKKK